MVFIPDPPPGTPHPLYGGNPDNKAAAFQCEVYNRGASCGQLQDPDLVPAGLRQIDQDVTLIPNQDQVRVYIVMCVCISCTNVCICAYACVCVCMRVSICACMLVLHVYYLCLYNPYLHSPDLSKRCSRG